MENPIHGCYSFTARLTVGRVLHLSLEPAGYHVLLGMIRGARKSRSIVISLDRVDARVWHTDPWP